MAFGANTLWQANSGGHDTNNGGGFNTGATFATDLAATTATGVPVVTSASYNFIARDVGHYLFIKSGTNWIPGWYAIASVSSNAATLTATIGSAILYSSIGGMASALNTATGCASTASPTSGTWSIDYSRSTAPAIAYTDMIVGATTTQYTSVADVVGPHIIGNTISVTSGATVQRVQVLSVSTITATCDKSLGTAAQTGVGGLGGALASPGMATGLAIANNWIAVRNTGSPTVYTFSNSSNVSGGKVTLPGGSSGTTVMFGYATNCYLNNSDVRPQIKPSANSTVLINAASGASTMVRNIDAQNPDAKTGCTGFYVEGDATIERCNADSLATGFLNDFNRNRFTNCSANNCTTSFAVAGGGIAEFCVATNSTGTTAGAFALSAQGRAIHCAVLNGTGIGFNVAGSSTLEACIVYGLTGANGTAFSLTPGATSYLTVVNCYAEGCAQKGYTADAYDLECRLFNCGAYNNASADVDLTKFDGSNNLGFLTLTGSAFTNAAGGDFTTNNTAGAGALLRGQGFPATFPSLSQSNAVDVGLYQHADAPAGGCQLVGRSGGLVNAL